MSDENLWGDDDGFVDMPDEAKLDSNGRPMQSPPAILQRPKTPVFQRPTAHPEPVLEEVLQEEVAFEDQDELVTEEEDLTDVLSDAHLRLEQGSLYKMIINHNLFEGTDADPKAIQNVQKEIREFAKERMEVMLGMRKETAVVEHLEIDFPFNALEVTTLKALARTATKGASDYSDNFVPEVTRTSKELDIIGAQSPPKKKSFTPIGGSPKQKTQPAPQTKKPLQNKPAAPLKRTKLDLTIDQIAAEEGIPRELLEENLSGVGGKPLHEMSELEIIERNKMIAKRRQTQVKSAKATPMPSMEQQAALAQSRADQFASSSPLMARILDQVKNMPSK